MTKIRTLTLCIAVCTLSACTFSPTPKPKEDNFNFNRTNYQLKEGVEESELQGAPWINSNLPGMTAKVEKPSLKDDFYASVNYDALVNNQPGPFNISSTNVGNQLSTILSEETEATNSALLRKAYTLINAGAKTEIADYLDNLDVSGFFNSKQLFIAPNSYFSITNTDNNQYYIQYNDGYFEGNYSLHSLMFLGRYYEKYYTAEIAVKNQLFDAFDIDIDDETYETIERFEHDLTNYSYSTYYNNGYQKMTYTLDSTGYAFLNNALLDAGFENGDTFVISNVSYGTLQYFDYLFRNYQQTVYNALCCRLAFGYRFLASIEKYRPISKALHDCGLFYYENDLTDIDDAKCARQLIRQSLASILERAYIELYTDASVKTKVAEVIEQVLGAYAALADEEEWLDLVTKKGLLRKLNKMKYVSCYSDKIKNYPAMSETGLESLSILGIINRYQEFLFELVLDNKIETDYFWNSMPSYTVNAFYSPQSNEFVILNGLLSGGFIGETIEETLAGVGFVIGHEISHSIDENGSQYDENGDLKNWWSRSCKNEFAGRVGKVKKFFSQINLFDETYVDGKLVNTEATADMGGMRVCLHLAKSIENFDYDRFFKAYARTWLSTAFSDADIEKHLEDEHPFDYLRCNVTIAQFDEFVETYGIQKGDGMYVPKKDRIAIW